jgi:hypothetical protein
MHLKDSEPFLSIFLWFCRLILAWLRRSGLQRGKVGSSVVVACSTLWGRPGLRPPGLMSICFTSRFSQAHEGVTSRFIGLLGLSWGLLSFQWTRGISVPHNLLPRRSSTQGLSSQWCNGYILCHQGVSSPQLSHPGFRDPKTGCEINTRCARTKSHTYDE